MRRLPNHAKSITEMQYSTLISPMGGLSSAGYTRAMRKSYLRSLPWVVIILILAFQLRVWQLDARALWFDEGVSLTFAITPIGDVTALHRLFDDTNPPVYRVFLGLTTHFFGVSVFAARYVSVLFGVLGVAVVYALSRSFRLSERVAVVALLVMAVAPVQVFYSREAKGYMLVQFCVLIVAFIWLRLFPLGTTHSRLPRRWFERVVLLVLIWLPTAAAFGSHYMSAIMLITINLWMLGWLINYQYKRPHATPIPFASLLWLSSQLLAVLTWVPWIVVTADRALAGAQSAVLAEGATSRGLTLFLNEMLSELVLGPTVELAIGSIFFLVAFMGVGMVKQSPVRWVIASWLFWPLVLGFAIQRFIPFFFPRFILFLSPGLFIAVVLVITRETQIEYRFAQAALSVGLAGIFFVGLVGIYSEPEPSPDLRVLTQHLEENLTPSDALIYSYSWQPGMVAAYLPAMAHSPEYYPSFFDADQFGSQIESILQTHSQTWLLTYQIGAETPSNDVGHWLLENGATAGSNWFADNQLTAFLSPVESLADQGCHSFSDAVISLCAPVIEDSRQAESALQLKLEWQTQTEIEANLIAFVHLLQSEGQPPVAQSDGLPANGLRPTFTWQPEETIVDRRVFRLPAEAGDYQLCAGLYDAESQERVAFDGEGDCAPLGQITVR